MTEDMTQRSVLFRAEVGRRATERGGVERVEQHERLSLFVALAAAAAMLRS